MQGQEEAMQPSSTESEAETKALQEELQLVLKKEREAQVSVQTLCCIKAILVFVCFLKSHNSCVCIPQKELSALRLAHQQSMHVDVKDSSDHQVGFSFHSQPWDGICAAWERCIYDVSPSSSTVPATLI